MIPHDFIDDLLARTDIVDVIDQYVPLKKSGANYMACCPFHKEKSPSFTVSPNKQFYHCFGCGAHGSAIGFVMEHQGLSFVEAVQNLADRVGMTVPQTAHSPQDQEKRLERKKQQQTLEKVMQQSADFYTQQLNLNPIAQQYAQKRGLSPEIIAHYGMGYAPDAWQGLGQVFDDYPNSFLTLSGMVIENEGKHYDRFRHRLMFPIRHLTGQVIGFGGRVLDDSKPKYLNSPDTPLFDKGKNLYGLYEARAAIQENQRILVVEGYMDVVALAQFGVGYAVAALGTATTAEHIKILMRQTDSIYFCFDGDEAGRKAAWRALENALPQLQDDKSLNFLFLPENHDPDSYVREFGKQVFEENLIHQSQTLSAYFWQHLTEHLDLNTQEGKAELVKHATPLLKQIAAPTLAYLLKQQLSQMVGIDPYNLAQLMGQVAPRRYVQPKSYQLPEQSFKPTETVSLAQKQIRALLLNPSWSQWVDFPDYLSVRGDLACLLALARIYQHYPNIGAAQALEHLRDTPFSANLERIFRLTEDDFDVDSEEARQSFQDGMARLMVNAKAEQIEFLKQKNLTEGLNTDEKQWLIQLLTQK